MPRALPFVASIQVGIPRQLGTPDARNPHEAPWESAIFKTPVGGPVALSATGLEGDRQADLTVHGGPDKALCVYSANHYPEWRDRLKIDPFPFGAFGENLTIDGLAEADVCIGDVWTTGAVVLQVSQPRQPCWKLARKWRITTLTATVLELGYTGWYFRVLTPGSLDALATMTLAKRVNPGWTVTAANDVMHHRKHDRDAAAALAAVDGLSASWRDSLAKRWQNA